MELAEGVWELQRLSTWNGPFGKIDRSILKDDKKCQVICGAYHMRSTDVRPTNRYNAGFRT